MSPNPNSSRMGSWTQTYTGRQFWPMDPRPDEVHIADIAHALSQLCRYNGHTRTHYSVAEHCVHLSYAVSAEHTLWALLHDATEAYVGDMVRPLKRHMPEYSAVEDHLMTVIAERFSLPGERIPDEVSMADTRIIIDEKEALMGPEPADWGLPFPRLGVKIHAWDAPTAEAAYLARFDELTT